VITMGDHCAAMTGPGRMPNAPVTLARLLA
jgi:hypothetical protein